jgi:hypothetical protein
MCPTKTTYLTSEGFLAQLESSLSADNARFQLLLDRLVEKVVWVTSHVTLYRLSEFLAI